MIFALLKFDPKERVSAMEALAHPFFDELRDINTKLPNGKRIDYIFELSVEEMGAVPPRIVRAIIPPWKQI